MDSYQFEYDGARFYVSVDADNPPPTTAEAPNVRVIEGAWPTWRATIDPEASGPESVILRRSADASGNSHPAGNPSSADVTSGNWQLMIKPDGSLYRIPGGWGLVGRLMNADEWDSMLAVWEDRD